MKTNRVNAVRPLRNVPREIIDFSDCNVLFLHRAMVRLGRSLK